MTTEPDEQGAPRSQVFPGLWLHLERFWTGDLPGLIAVLNQASPARNTPAL